MVPNDNTRRPLQVPPEPGKWLAMGLAALMHLLLVLAFIFGVSWHTTAPGPVQAELWTALPPPNRPEPEPTPDPTPTPAPRPTPAPAPKPPPPPPPEAKPTTEKPDIAIEQEKKRREAEKKRQADQDAADQRERDRKEADRKLADKKAADKKEADRKEAEQDKREADKKLADKKEADRLAAEKAQKAIADKAAAEKANVEKLAAEKKAAAEKRASDERDRKLRDAFRSDTARAAGLEGGKEGGREGGNADRNQAAGASGNPGYADLIRSCIRPHVIYNPSGTAATGNPTAVFQVQLLPSGEQAGPPRLQRSSGVPAFDRAVENGIRRCDPFPRPPSGRFESNITVQHKMFD